MRKIINGKMYNTETAKKICEYYSVLCCDELYQKRTGEFFLYIENEYRCGKHIITPVSEGEAKIWLERHDFVDEYIELFGEPEE